MTPVRRLSLWTGVATALGLVFFAYLQPDFVVALANQLWSCF
jgi:hypothetical protein